MNSVHDDPQTEAALLAFIVAAADLAARLDARGQAMSIGRRVALDILAKRLQPARTAAENAFSATIFSE